MNVSSRALKYCAAVASCAAIAFCTLHFTKSAAQTGMEGRQQAGRVANSNTPAPIFGVTIPPGYRDWRLISVAHEAGNLNDLRAVLGNDAAIKAYRQGAPSFPDGTIITRLAWNYVPSEENNKVFGRAQSFVPGSATDWYLQVMVKDSKRYAATDGWGFAQFDENGKPADEAKHKTCLPCHEGAKAHDFVFTHYAP